MAVVLEDLRAQREELVGEIEALAAADDFNPSDESFVNARSRAEQLDSKIKSLVEWSASRDAANAIDAMQVKAHRSVEVAKREASDGLSPGQIFTRSREWDDYKSAPRGTSGRVEIDLDLMIHNRAPLTTVSFTDVMQPQRLSNLNEPIAPTPLLSIIDRIPVNSNSVEWIYYPASTVAPAAVVPELGQKPEAAIAPELRTVTLETIAHYLELSRQMNEDSGTLRAYIDSALRRGVVERMELQAAAVLAADATIPVTPNATGTLLEGIRMGIATVQGNGYSVNGVGLHPSDYAAIDIDIMAGTQRGPNVNGSVWGVDIVPLPSLTPGTSVLGDFRTGMAWLARNSVSLYETDSHLGNFTINVITLLAETRGVAVIHRPDALTKVSGTTTVVAGAQSAPRQPERKS